jgi:DNA-binding transcriptional MerR regulator
MANNSTIDNMPTVGEIARRNGVSVHKVEYVIRSRNMQPAARAGNARVFGAEDVERIGAELRCIAAEKEMAS